MHDPVHPHPRNHALADAASPPKRILHPAPLSKLPLLCHEQHKVDRPCEPRRGIIVSERNRRPLLDGERACTHDDRIRYKGRCNNEPKSVDELVERRVVRKQTRVAAGVARGEEGAGVAEGGFERTMGVTGVRGSSGGGGGVADDNQIAAKAGDEEESEKSSWGNEIRGVPKEVARVIEGREGVVGIG